MAAETALKANARQDISHREYRVYAHSPILYWWPVWVVGFLMTFWTYVEDEHRALGNRLAGMMVDRHLHRVIVVDELGG